ncbi:MAG: hypothetical protein KDB14_13565 [Planctomycetales bacterium]|nr:hypothetical protein [Planctomycetales bacterium]
MTHYLLNAFLHRRAACGLALLLALTSLCGPLAAQEAPTKRTWKAASGGYSVDATLIEQGNGTVKLRKEDGLVVTVQLSLLSKEDQDYVAGLAKQQNPFAGGVPAALPAAAPGPAAMAANQLASPDEVLVLPGDGVEVALSTAAPPAPLDPDPMPPLLSVKPGNIRVADTDPYDKVSPLSVLDPQTGTVALTIGRNKAGKPEETRGRILIGKLPNGPFQTVLDTDQSLYLLDHHPGTGQTLMVSGVDNIQRGGELQLVEKLGADKPVVRLRRLLPGHDKPGFKPQASKGWLLAKDIAVVQVNDALYCWNLATNQLLYRTPRNTASTLRIPAFSGGRRYLAVPDSKGFHLIESASGKHLGFVDAEMVGTPGVAFHPDGKRIAVTASNTWAVYDLAAGQLPQSGVVSAHLHHTLVGWITNDWFLTESGDVVDPNLGMVVWHYYSGNVGRTLGRGTLTAASTISGLKLTTLPMPSDDLNKAYASLSKRKDLWVTQPGTEVKIVISVEDADADALEAALSESVLRAGWKINPDAKLAVIATIGRGKPYELKYREGPGLGRNGPEHTVKINPFTANLQIRDANGVLWTRDTENHVPRMLFLRGGETVQEAAKRYERPQPEFFSSMRIPPRIPKGDLDRGLGSSRIDDSRWVDFTRK